MSAEATVKKHRKERIGIVVSDKQDKTIAVRVDRRIPHDRYGKIITRSKKFHAHDEYGKASLGDKVLIEETIPLSKNKRWLLVRVLHRGE